MAPRNHTYFLSRETLCAYEAGRTLYPDLELTIAPATACISNNRTLLHSLWQKPIAACFRQVFDIWEVLYNTITVVIITLTVRSQAGV